MVDYNGLLIVEWLRNRGLQYLNGSGIGYGGLEGQKGRRAEGQVLDAE